MKDGFATQSETVQACDPGSCSFFGLVEEVCGSPNQPLHRFCSLMRKMGTKGLLREQLELNEELAEERDQAAQRCQGAVDLKATRLTFFCSMPDGGVWDESHLPANHLLGYAVIVRLKLPDGRWIAYVLEAVARPPAVVYATPGDEVKEASIAHYYLHNTREFETSIGPRDSARILRLVGSFFAQQNDLTHVCAHACLRMAINSSPTFDGHKLTNKRINDILDLDFSSAEKMVGHYEPVDNNHPHRTGLTGGEIEAVVQSLGGRVLSADFHEKPTIDYDYFVYPLMESGCPVFLVLEGWDARDGRFVSHVVSIVGHTLNTDRWAPEARFGYGNFPVTPYSSATEWVDHFIINDDNYGMYLTLPSDMVRNFILPTKNPTLHATRAVGIVPAGVNLSGYHAEQISSQIATRIVDAIRSDHGLPLWLQRLQGNSLVCRTLLQRRDEYKAHIESILQTIGDDLTPVQAHHLNNLPPYVWVTEVSLPQLYTANKHKLGDIVINAGASENEHREWKSFVFGWLPGVVIYDLQNQHLDEWGVTSHVPLIRRAGTSDIEW